ncbi:hypothetical protein RQP46_009597 [Phenoliferia psychrophenolica]
MLLLGRDLYRALLREARALPDSAATSHYESLIRTSFRLPPAAESSAAPLKRVQVAQRLLRQLQAANDGYLHSLTRVLDTTYARRGPGKHALLRPFILSPTSLPHSSHAFSPSLSALLTSSISHTTRPPRPSHLISPPSLPPRADPSSEEARLLGPLTPQRVRAIRLRYWNSQTAKLRAPLAVQVRAAAGGENGQQLVRSAGVASGVLQKAGVMGVDVEAGWRRLEELEGKARVPDDARPRVPRRLQTRDERTTKGPTPFATPPKPQQERKVPRILSPLANNTKWHLPKTLSPRLLRRRFAHVLDNSPILTVIERAQGPVGFEVSKSTWAKGGMGHVGAMSEEDLWWIGMDDAKSGGAAGGGGGERKGKAGGKAKKPPRPA